MEPGKLIEVLRATIDPNRREQAEVQLGQIQKLIGFAPSLLQVVMMSDCDMPIRQAGAIYLKNLVSQSWHGREGVSLELLPFSIHEQDRSLIRETIVDAIVHAPDLIRLQLCTCVHTMVKYDFPIRWTQIVDKISIYLTNPEASGWHGAILCLYQLVKHFEYKKAEERVPLHEAMNHLLPQLYQLVVSILADPSEHSALLQKEALKVYFTLTQYTLPLGLISRGTFTQWMEVCRQIVERPVPPAALQPDEDDRPDLPWWKCKKWALHILYRLFERYGSPGNVTKEYSEFAEWYLQTFSCGILEVLLRLFDDYRGGAWLPPRVLQQSLNYVNQAVSHAHTWRLLKPHMCAIIQDVLFPLLSYSREDEELWSFDPHEYIRVKFDVFENFVSPVTAAKTLLHSTCQKRKGMLQKTMQFLSEVLNHSNTEPSKKEGSLHMVGALADVLLRKKTYREQLDQLFLKYVFPEFASPRGHVRARVCWVLHSFSEFSFNQEPVLAEAIRLTINLFLHDKEKPVRVQAAIALQSLLNYQERSHKYVEPQVKQIALELLTIIRETENTDVTGVMEKLVYVYTMQLAPIAVEICQHLATTFTQVMNADEGSDEKGISATGLLDTISTLLTVFEEQSDILRMLEPSVVQVVVHVLQSEVREFYEEIVQLICDCTNRHISTDMWQVLDLLYQVLMKSGADHFIDMMPALHNYITVDVEAFLSDSRRLMAIYDICKEVLSRDLGEDPEEHAAKLLEVVLLQCRGRIDSVAPTLIEVAAGRLLRKIQTSELRIMLLLVLIAALYYNPSILFGVLEKMPDFAAGFIKQWILDVDSFLGVHDRKLCVLGLCTLISLPRKPSVLVEMAPKVMPAIVRLFDGLKLEYEARAQEAAEEEEESETDDDNDDDDVEEVLSSDEDDISEQGEEYVESLAGKVVSSGGDDGSLPVSATVRDFEDDSDCEADEEMALESYTTPIDEESCDVDEYLIFKEVMSRLESTERDWYKALTGTLTDDQMKSLMEISMLADQRKAAKESKRIAEQGGYNFTNQQVPTSFNFGS